MDEMDEPVAVVNQPFNYTWEFFIDIANAMQEALGPIPGSKDRVLYIDWDPTEEEALLLEQLAKQARNHISRNRVN